MDTEKKSKKLEIDVLNVIEEKLRSGEMDAARAQAIAKILLEKLHSPLALEQLYKIVSLHWMTNLKS